LFGIASGLLSLFRGLRKLERAAREDDAETVSGPPGDDGGRGGNDRA
jgi:HAMP domain-containing protein